MKKFIKIFVLFLFILSTISGVFALTEKESKVVKLASEKIEEIIVKKGENSRELYLLALQKLAKKYENNKSKQEIINEIYKIILANTPKNYSQAGFGGPNGPACGGLIGGCASQDK